ncbi:MAG: NYN domain-containing protein [Acidobacteria bacterium]|nr:NYN domain-containing protein [Acidobacteriota bacterium]
MRATSGITAQTGMTGMRGRVAIFIDGNNLFHAARSAGVEIDYAKLLNFLRGESPLLRAFFYTGVDERAERQQGFLLWMRRNGYRVVQKELKTFSDGTKKANLDVEIAVDMLSLVGNYDTAILVSGDEDFAYAINVIAYKGVRVEIGGFRSNTSPRLIDVADRFIDFDGVISEICKAESRYAPYPNVRPGHTSRYAPAAGSGAPIASNANRIDVPVPAVPATTVETMPVAMSPQPPQPEPPVSDPYAAPREPEPASGLARVLDDVSGEPAGATTLDV